MGKPVKGNNNHVVLKEQNTMGIDNGVHITNVNRYIIKVVQ
jgi:hypothetical protein